MIEQENIIKRFLAIFVGVHVSLDHRLTLLQILGGISYLTVTIENSAKQYINVAFAGKYYLQIYLRNHFNIF